MHKITVLDNGLRVVTNFMPHTRSVCMAVLVGAGSCYEIEREAGISHFAEHLFFKGTERRPTAKELSQDIEGIGGTINGGTDRELTVYWCKVAYHHFPTAVDVLSDLLLHSRFHADDMDQERQVIMEEIKMNLDLPQQRAGMVLNELLWPEQPLGREVLGDKETVASIGRGELVGYVAGRYLPNNAVVSVAGNIAHEDAVAQVARAFARWSPGELSTTYPSDDSQSSARMRVEARDSEQVHLCLAVHGLSHLDPQRFTVDLLATVLGGGMSSRLFTEIREKRGLAYDIHCYTDHFVNSGSVNVYAGVDPENAETATAAILDQLSAVKRGTTPDELTRAQELSKGRLYLRLENTYNVALWHGTQEVLAGRILTMDEVISIVDAVTLDDLTEVAERLLTSEQLNLALVGPVKDGPSADLLHLQ